jgi:hypothetical protein
MIPVCSGVVAIRYRSFEIFVKGKGSGFQKRQGLPEGGPAMVEAAKERYAFHGWDKGLGSSAKNF